MPTRASGRDVAVVGAGPAGLMAAEVMVRGGATVTVYDRMPSPGRKFLLAGRGGLNLTHSEDLTPFRARYGSAETSLRPALDAFSPAALRAWCEALGQPTFVGSSGRVFPASFKTSPLLRAWLRRLDAAGVVFRPRHRWCGWGGTHHLLFETPDGPIEIAPDAVVLALGGASWPQLGSDGAWVGAMQAIGVETTGLRPSNCGFAVAWSPVFKERFEGVPLKGIGLGFEDRSLRGEAVVTRGGIEGGGIYALSPFLREALARSGEAVLRLALLPRLSAASIESRLEGRPAKRSLSTHLSKALNLPPVAVALLHEVTLAAGERLSDFSCLRLARAINDVPLRLIGTAPLARAISTAGGIPFDELDETLMLKRRPGCFAAGEMLDWEAPTGGYLLQGAFATGALAGHGALAWLEACRRD